MIKRMKATIEWMKDAREGGFEFEHYICDHCEEMMMSCNKIELEKALINPLAWQAVGKVRGWHKPEELPVARKAGWNSTWTLKQLAFVRRLQEGKNIEQALEAISK